MRFTNLTARNEIGANCYLVETDGRRLLLDCGSHPRIEGTEALPRLDLLAERGPDAVLVSHGHLDHLGSLPVLAERFPEAAVCMSHGTAAIADRALHNSASVMIRQRSELDLPDYPLFTHGQVDRLLERTCALPVGRGVDVAGVETTLFEAGHVQGATGVWIEAEGASLFYTGDVKFSGMRITRGAIFPDRTPDAMVLECTRGNTQSQPDFSWDAEAARFARGIREVHEGGGSVLIPCFALGKTQEILKLFHDFIREGLLPKQRFYLGGLGAAYNEVYDDLAETLPRLCPRFRLRRDVMSRRLNPREAAATDLDGGQVFLVSSGMMTPGTSSHVLARRMVREARHAVFFVGYVDPESPAGRLKTAGQGGRADLGGDAGIADIRCRIESFDFTSHCNREHMADYVVRIAPPRVLLVHGDTPALEWMQRELQRRLPASRVLIPPVGEGFDLA
ncbi:MAG: MBL fold metallo-hydrolase [Verrucomicrobiae bacterium]|nr:MBL fold metallo-hydrolase [Verrucomicrobiae bacterium]